jgi:hypothetical protein
MKTKLQLLFVAVLFSISANAFDRIAIIGDAVGGWDTAHEIALETTDGVHYTLSNFQLLAGGFKFRANSSWHDAIPVVTGQNDWGYDGTLASGWPSGNGKSSLDGFVGGISNIQAVSGYWNVTFNLATHDYAFTEGVSPFATINYTGTSVGGATIPMTTTDGINYVVNSVNTVAGDGQIVRPATANPVFSAANWSTIDFPAGKGVQGGTLIPVPLGAYNITFNMTTGDYEFFPVVVGVIGNVAGSTWGTDFDMTTTDGINYTLLDQAFLVNPTPPTPPALPDPEARLKIRDNHSWNVNFGTSTGTDGSNSPSLSGTSQNGKNGGGGNIFIPYGTYDVSFNRTTGAWAFTLKSLAVDKFDAGSFKAYPNPTTSNWNITSGNDDITSIQVYDIQGKAVYTKFGASKEVSVNASELSRGVYFAKVSTANGTSTLKLVKE